MLSDWTYPILAVVFITWGLGFIGLAAWSIHKEYEARQDQTETATPLVPDREDATEGGGTQDEAAPNRKLPRP